MAQQYELHLSKLRFSVFPTSHGAAKGNVSLERHGSGFRLKSGVKVSDLLFGDFLQTFGGDYQVDKPIFVDNQISIRYPGGELCIFNNGVFHVTLTEWGAKVGNLYLRKMSHSRIYANQERVTVNVPWMMDAFGEKYRNDVPYFEDAVSISTGYIGKTKRAICG